MIKKIGALMLTATMMFSLVGCGKNFDGNYTADIDLTDVFVESLESEMGSEIDFEWSGSVVMPYHLELSEGEYTLSVDADATAESLKTFVGDNIETYISEALATELEAAGLTVDEALESYGYSSIWELMGYDSKDAFLDEMMAEMDISELEETEEGEYEIDGDSITLEGVETISEDGEEGEGWVLTYEDGSLTGILDTSEFGLDGIDENLDVTFELDED
ncbi:MAG: hypothetical protein K6G87_18855 [Butyrivibrio sp.]|uniref:hypothetical protein n=1 Tax=Butyrivibrio sp. TaxID=28121 RepID=UPI0025FBE86F|nr:hypothetical protein [Butyrivibrio sp.]MCR5773285.1 hypothetical protein [Butyrivibrio sp.]